MGVVRGITVTNTRTSLVTTPKGKTLETEVGERLVGFGHAMQLLHAFSRRHHDLRKPRAARLRDARPSTFTTLASSVTDPAHRERRTARRTHLNRHLEVGAANTAALHFNHRLMRCRARWRILPAGPCRLFADDVQRAIHDAFGNSLLPAVMMTFMNLEISDIAKLRIRQDVAFG